ncbi:MAG: putative hemolysin [Planctomycetota bacterium]|jgi:putative hemolysin
MSLREHSAPNSESASLESAPSTELEGVRESLSGYRGRPLAELLEGRYRVRFAGNAGDLERVLRLRFEVFNLEMNEGLQASYGLGLDLDAFDMVCDHLMVEETLTGRLVGTYRLQLASEKADGLGLYCAQEYDLSTLPPDVINQSVELGRACVAPADRNGHALFALWRGLAAYAQWTKRRYFFGCCSLTSQDKAEGRAFERFLVRKGHMREDIHVEPWEALACGDAGQALVEEPAPKVPTLFASYLRFGAMVCSSAAIDREFKTIDFLVLFDRQSLSMRVRRLIFSGIPEHDATGGYGNSSSSDSVSNGPPSVV